MILSIIRITPKRSCIVKPPDWCEHFGCSRSSLSSQSVPRSLSTCTGLWQGIFSNGTSPEKTTLAVATCRAFLQQTLSATCEAKAFLKKKNRCGHQTHENKKTLWSQKRYRSITSLPTFSFSPFLAPIAWDFHSVDFPLYSPVHSIASSVASHLVTSTCTLKILSYFAHLHTT